MSRYPASQIAPFSMLVPVIGLSSSALLLNEQLSQLQMLGALLVMAGLLINVFGGRVYGRLVAPKSWAGRTCRLRLMTGLYLALASALLYSYAITWMSEMTGPG